MLEKVTTCADQPEKALGLVVFLEQTLGGSNCMALLHVPPPSVLLQSNFAQIRCGTKLRPLKVMLLMYVFNVSVSSGIVHWTESLRIDESEVQSLLPTRKFWGLCWTVVSSSAISACELIAVFHKTCMFNLFIC